MLKEAVPFFVQDSWANLQFIDSLIMYWFIFFNRLKYVFEGYNPILLLSIQSGVRVIEVINDRN